MLIEARGATGARFADYFDRSGELSNALRILGAYGAEGTNEGEVCFGFGALEYALSLAPGREPAYRVLAQGLVSPRQHEAARARLGERAGKLFRHVATRKGANFGQAVFDELFKATYAATEPDSTWRLGLGFECSGDRPPQLLAYFDLAAQGERRVPEVRQALLQRLGCSDSWRGWRQTQPFARYTNLGGRLLGVNFTASGAHRTKLYFSAWQLRAASLGFFTGRKQARLRSIEQALGATFETALASPRSLLAVVLPRDGVPRAKLDLSLPDLLGNDSKATEAIVRLCESLEVPSEAYERALVVMRGPEPGIGDMVQRYLSLDPVDEAGGRVTIHFRPA